MSIRSKEELKSRPMEIDLTGPDGNVFALMGKAQRLARELGLDSNAIVKEMTTGDYDHAVEVFEQHFGEYVVLYR